MMLGILSFEGTADRAEWWTTILLSGLVAQVAIPFALVARYQESGANWLVFVALLVVGMGAIWASIAVTAKRFRDRGDSPWLTLLIFVPVIGEIWVLVVCGFLPHPYHIRRTTVVRKVAAKPQNQVS